MKLQTTDGTMLWMIRRWQHHRHKMRYKEIDINIKAIPDKEDEEILNQLIGSKNASVTTDTAEKINYPLLSKRTKLIFATAWYLANSNNKLKAEKI